MQNELKDLRELKKKFKKAVLSRKHTIDELRLAYDDILYSPYVPNNVDLSEIKLRGVDTDVLKPEMAVSGRVILYAHGGSFISGTKKTYRSFCAGLAHEASADLYLPEYKTAPEHPFPAALEDVYKVYARLIESHKVESANLILAGDGAGGGLILSLIHYLKNKRLPLPALLILFSPWADLSCSSEGLSVNRKKDFVFSQEALLGAAQLYTEEKNLTNELVSPIFGNFENFPPVFIQCGSNEILLDDSIRLCEKIEKAGGRAVLDKVENMPHLFQAVPDYFANAHIAVEAVGKKITGFFDKGSVIENKADLIGGIIMELLSPAGNFEKLDYAWEYGADAAYIGLKNFSLRAKADNFSGEEYKNISLLKEEYKKRGLTKKLYCAINISFHNEDLKNLLEEVKYFKQYPFDAFIVQDLGAARILKENFPDIPLHLSTQANCINYEAVRVYKDLGFSRVVLGREASLEDVREIKQRVPEIELECFVHGAMCISYSGRCLISAYLTDRSANAGACTHSCRWNYKMYSEKGGHFFVEESERKGELFPVEEGENYTALFSSKDLCMIDYLDKMKEAGVDSLKIEGRMKSIYYTALTARAYRKKIDFLNGKISADEAAPFVEELYNTAHREFSTGFYFSSAEANKTTAGESKSPYMLAGKIGKKLSENEYEFISMNKIDSGIPLEYVGPDICSIEDRDYTLLNPDTKEKMDWVCHGHPCIIKTDKPIAEKFLVRCKENL